MSVYNSEEFIKESISSILQQSYHNFEFIIVDDGSKDQSKNIIKSYSDSRIVFVENQFNIGLAASLNKAISLSKGAYIVRMDADDICLINRLKYQIEFLEKNEHIDICGGYISRIDKTGRVYKRVSKMPLCDGEIKSNLLYSNQLFHPTVVFKTSFFKKNNIQYNEDFIRTQDYELWSRLAFDYQAVFANIPRIVLKYRRSRSVGLKNRNNKSQFLFERKVRLSNFNKLGVLYKNADFLFNKLRVEPNLSRIELLKIIILMREINCKSFRRFKHYPHIHELQKISQLGMKGIIIFINERIYRNLPIEKAAKYFYYSIFNKDCIN